MAKSKKSPHPPKITKSKESLKALASRDKEARILKAMARRRLEPNTSIRQIAKDAGLAHSTLAVRIKGGRSASAANEVYQTLTNADENRLTNVLLYQAKTGAPVNKEQLYCLVDEMIDQRYPGDEGNPVATTKKPTKNPLTGHYVSTNWVVGFLKRNPRISFKNMKGLNTYRFISSKRDTPPPKDNLLRLDEEFEKGFSNKDAVREFYRKLGLLATKMAKNPQYAETHARCLILMEQAAISSITTIKHSELFEKKMEQLSKGKKGKTNSPGENSVVSDMQVRGKIS